MRMRLIIFYLCLALFNGCGGGSASGSNGMSELPSVPHPTNLLVDNNSLKPYECILRWTASNGVIDGYILEGKIDNDNYQVLNSDPIPPNFLEVTVILPIEVPETSSFTFRVKAVKGTASSYYSNEVIRKASVNRPFAGLALFNGDLGGIEISWTSNSQIVQSFLLERALSDSSFNQIGPWNTFPPISPLKTTYIDTSIDENSYYIYKISNVTDSFKNSCPDAMRVSVPIIPCKNLQATQTTTGIKLTWTNRSSIATSIVVKRGYESHYLDTTLTTLPSSATSYDDSNLPSGYFYYQIITRSGGLESSSNVVLGTRNNSTSGTTFQLLRTWASIINGAPVDADYSSAHGWAAGTIGPLGVTLENHLIPDYVPLDVYYWPISFLKNDSKGWPHLVYYKSIIGSSRLKSLMHDWYDGSRWQSEEVLQREIRDSSSFSPVIMVLDSYDNPSFLVESNPGGSNLRSTDFLEYIHKSTGSWVIEPMSGMGLKIVDFESTSLALDPENVPYIIVAKGDGFVEYTKSGDGGWVYTVLPIGNPLPGGFNLLNQIRDIRQTSWVFYERNTSPGVTDRVLYVLEQLDGFWQPPIALGSRPVNGKAQTMTDVSFSSTYHHPVLLYSSDLGDRVFNRTSTGWQETLVGQSHGYPAPFSIRINDNNKIQLLLGYTETGLRIYSE